MEFAHKSVLLDEAVDALEIKPDGIYVDATAGGGGHSNEILKRLSDKGLLIAIDQDEDAIRTLNSRFGEYKNVKIVKSNFYRIRDILSGLGILKIDGFLADLGVSSYQLDNAERGFSYNSDAPLDMRMDKDVKITAKDIVNTWSAEEIARILFEYSEEKFSRQIARKIAQKRNEKPIETTSELVDIILSAVPSFARREKQHPAKRSFQALRIAVNDELGVLRKLLENLTDVMNKDGKIAIITFHSLEDRIVKNAFAEMAKTCVCPPDFPVCVCNTRAKLVVETKKPVVPDEKSINENPRARSAKLRVAKVI